MKLMKKRSFGVLALAVALFLSLGLSGCKKEEPVPQPDQVAEVIFDMCIRNDATKAVELFGYASEEEARLGMIGDETSFQDSIVESLATEMENMGLTMTEDELKPLIDGTLTMLGKLEYSAEVTEMDEKAGTATVISHIGYYDSEATNAAIENIMNELIEKADPAVLATEEGVTQLLKDYLARYAETIATMEPAEGTKDFETAFELAEMEINGKSRKVWVPEDTVQFGTDLSTNALGG